jgi:hypothetical protein
MRSAPKDVDAHLGRAHAHQVSLRNWLFRKTTGLKNAHQAISIADDL